MTRRRWERISKIFADTAKLHPSGRSAYLDKICRDTAIRAEVESLLAHHKPAPLLGVHPSFDGVLLGHYEMIEEIGHGSMGQVYKARDVYLDRIVAAKLLVPFITEAPGYWERLKYEAKCASALNHPNIVIVHDIVCEEGVNFIVMEYVQGKTLQNTISPNGLPVTLALDYAIEITHALETAHAAGIIHGDLKPPNIMVAENGPVKLLDFGLARALEPDPAMERPSQPMGTRAYMAPECFRNQLPDERSEIFTVGLIVHQMLSGKHPFGPGPPKEISEAIQHDEPKPLPRRVPHCLSQVVDRCLEKDPGNRFASIQEVLVELQDCADEILEESPLPDPLDNLALPIEKIDAERALAIVSQIKYSNAVRSRNALDSLTRLLEAGAPAPVRDEISRALREVILTVQPDTNGVALSIRNIRKQTMQTLKRAVQGNLCQLFSEKDFEAIDLFGMDFSDAKLLGLHFTDSFLAHADFRRADLRACSLAGAWLRNANFQHADLVGADFTGADWFNAIGFAESQMASVMVATLMDCPGDLSRLRGFLERRYRYSFQSWGTVVQKELMGAWNEYLRPGGLRDILLASRKSRP